MFKGLTARRHYKSFGVKGLTLKHSTKLLFNPNKTGRWIQGVKVFRKRVATRTRGTKAEESNRKDKYKM
jgi:hypothetical protein